MNAQGWADDEELLADLGAALRDVGADAERVAADARGLYTWRTVDEELLLASLSFDSLQQAGGPVRGDDGEPRLLVFDAAPLSVELEVTADRIVGQLVPPGPGDIVVETDAGPPAHLAADELGFFLVTVPRESRRIRLHCDTATGRVVTGWVTL